jgi:DNA-directed RNA polymerase subunit RPC12/RpoP
MKGMEAKCLRCKHIWDTEKKSYKAEIKCPICGNDLLVDIQQTRLREAWIQYPVYPEIPKSMPLIRFILLLKLSDLELI